MFARLYSVVLLLLACAVSSFATTPVVTVSAPGTGASVASPVNFIASASSSCAQGISAMRIYTANGVIAYTINASKLNTNINLPKGTYSTVVQAWDKCGGIGKTTVNITISSIKLAPPKFLYATEFKAGKIAEYVVNPLTGSIKPTSQGSTWAHWGPVDIASDHWGNHLYVANQGSHDLSAYFINRSSGNLTQVPGSPFALAGVGHRVAVTPSGKFVYVTSTSSSGGAVSSSAVNAFAVQSNGALATVGGSPFTLPVGTPALAIDPKGRFLYVSSSSNGVGAVAGYTINQTNGALTPVPGSPFIVPKFAGCSGICQESPADLAVDPQSKYLYGVLGGEDGMAGFAIDQSTGALANLPGSPYPENVFCTGLAVCQAPWTESIDPSGKFIYVSDVQSNDIAIFKLNGSTGVLSYAGASGNTQGGICVPYTVSVDPSGTFLYNLGITSTGCAFTSGTTNAVVGFSINRGNGQLLSVPGSPFPNSGVHTTNTSEEKVLLTR